MERRLFLRSAGLAGTAALLGACGRRAGSPTVGPSQEAGSALARVAPGAKLALAVIHASFEQLTGKDQPLAFGLATLDNKPVKDADVQLYLAPDDRKAAGPFPVRFAHVPGVSLGLYVTQLDFPVPEPTTIVVVTADGAQGGETVVQVTTPENSEVPAPGRAAIAAATPTVSDPMGSAQLCTRKPPCGMHETSLDAALRDRRPVMLTFATPAYCQTAVCGPSVSTLEQVRTSRDWGDVAFIHVEIFRDAGQTVTPAVQEWGLPSEPWLFAVGRDGKIAGRADGALLSLLDPVTRMADALTA